MNPLFIALQFLTRFPVKANYDAPADVTNSIYWYGCVGFLIGTALWITQSTLLWLNPTITPMLIAALIVSLWVFITGALHLDGLADTADAWVGGTSKEKVLSIMKDPRCGPAGVVIIVLTLLLKFCALQQLIAYQSNSTYLIIIPSLVRMAIPYLFLKTAYVRAEGIGSPFQKDLNLTKIHQYAAGTLIGLMIIAPAIWVLSAVILLSVVFLSSRYFAQKKIGGITGDIIGAMIELSEAALLLFFCFIF